MHHYISLRSLRIICAITYTLFSTMLPFVAAAEGTDGLNKSYSTDAVTIAPSETPVRYFWQCEIPTERESRYYDVPLSHELQDHIFEQCKDKNVEPTLVFAVIEKESRFKADAIGDHGRSFGLMQIQERWVKDRMKRLGVTDLRESFQNVTVGIDILSEYIDRSGSIEWALMAYNGGGAYANRKTSRGEVSDYARTVIENSEKYVHKNVTVVVEKIRYHDTI